MQKIQEILEEIWEGMLGKFSEGVLGGTPEGNPGQACGRLFWETAERTMDKIIKKILQKFLEEF